MDINGAWNSVCNTLLEGEIGKLEEFQDYLCLYHYPIVKKKSASGKEIAFSTDRYCETAKLLSYDEVDFRKRYKPLNLCHNIEDCQECMFCFNVKSLRYAIGNVEVGKERYLKIKRMVLDEISKKLEKDKNLGISIYNIGCKAK